MPLPMAIARVNKRVTNKVLWPIVRLLPGFVRIVHTGRSSGREYRTPVMVFAKPGGYVMALTYGPQTDWVRNVVAAGGGALDMQGRTIPVTSPRLVHDPTRRIVPFWARLPLRILRVSDFLEVGRTRNR